MGIFVPIVWALGFTGAKAAMDQFPPIMLMAMRFSVAAIVLVWFTKPPWSLMWRIFIVTVISATIPYSTIFTGLNHLDASTAMLVVQAQVPFMALVAIVFLKESLTIQRAIGFVVAMAGVVLIAGQPELRGSIGWILLTVGGCFVWASGQVMIRVLSQSIDGKTLIAWVSVFTVPQLIISSAIFETGQIEALMTADWYAWTLVLYMGLIMTAAGYYVWYTLLSKIEIGQASPFLLLQPPITVVASIFLLGENPTWMTLIGGGIVIAGVATITFESRQKK